LSTATKGLAVKIMGKEYQITCPQGQTHSLLDAAMLLDDKMNEIRKSGRVIGTEKIAVMAALNLTHELLANQLDSKKQDINFSEKISSLCEKVDKALVSE